MSDRWSDGAEHDDAQAWTQYRNTRSLMRANWHFLTGNPADTRRLARLLGFEYWIMDSHVAHDFKIIVLDASGLIEKEIGPAPTDCERLF